MPTARARRVLFISGPENEIEKILGADDAGMFNECYGVTDEGNFEEKNILSRTVSIEELAVNADCGVEHIHEILSKSRTKLLAQRNTRIRPSRDEKIIAGWNGMMIESLAYGGAAMGEQKYIDAAAEAADFVLGALLEERPVDAVLS